LQPQRSWLPLFLGVLFCTFVGGGLRVLLAPEVVSKWVHSLVEKKETRFYFNFAKAQISLANGWRPHLAVKLSDVEFGAKDPCISSSKLTADHLVIPLKISALWRRDVQFGHVQVGNLDVNLRQRDVLSNCPKGLADSDGNINTEIQNLEKFLSTRWKKEINNTLRYLTEFSVQKLRLMINDQIEPQFQLEELALNFSQSSGEGHAEFIFWPGFYWSAGQPFGPTQIQIKVSEQDVSWSGEGNLKEGQIYFSGAWEIEKSEILGSLNWVDVPLANMVALFDRWGFINIQEFKPIHQWSSCSINSSGNIRDWKNLKFKIDQCVAKGDLGDYIFSTVGLYLARAESYPLNIQFQNANVKAVLDAFGLPAFKSLSHYGSASGRLIWPEKNKWKAEGDVVGAEVFISMLDPKHRLAVGPAQFEVNYKDHHVLGVVRAANSLGLGAQAQLQFEKLANSDAANIAFGLDINDESGALKMFSVLPYRELKMNLQAKTDFHQFYNVKGSLILNEVMLDKNTSFYTVGNNLLEPYRVLGEVSGPVRILKSESKFAVLENNSLFAEGRFEVTHRDQQLPFQFEVLMQDRNFESGKIMSLMSSQRRAVFLLRGSLQEPRLQ
jgi:hypothetical protein